MIVLLLVVHMTTAAQTLEYTCDKILIRHDATTVLQNCILQETVFSDGFESGNTSRWLAVGGLPSNPIH